MTYIIQYVWQGSKTRAVQGFAFETPGWPEFHACIRHDRRSPWDAFDDWILDHYESGLAIAINARIERKEDAPAMVAAYLATLGREKVRKALEPYINQ
jgi:hypothetical protein